MFSEVWERAEITIRQEIKEQTADASIERWIASADLISNLRNGLRDASFETRVKIIYGFEQVLPQVAFA